MPDMMFTEGLDASALQWVYSNPAPPPAPAQQLVESPTNSNNPTHNIDQDEEDSDAFSAESSTGSFHVPLNPSIWPDSSYLRRDSLPDSPLKSGDGDVDDYDERIIPPTAPPILSMEEQKQNVNNNNLNNDVNNLSNNFKDTSEEAWSYPAVESFRYEYEREYVEYVESSTIPVDQPLESSEVNAAFGTANQSVNDSNATRIRDPSEREKQAAPVFLSGQASWQSIIAYEACVRLCLRAWSAGCEQAPDFLLDECRLLRACFGLQQVLLQPKGEQPENGLRDDADSGSGAKPKTTAGKLKVQVRKIRVIPRQPLRANSSSMYGNAFNTGAQYVKQVSGLLKAGVNTLRSTTLLDSQEAYICVLKPRSLPDNESVRVQPGYTATFYPEATSDELFIDVYDSKNSLLGRSTVQISVADDSSDRVQWWPIYNDPDRECIGKLQLYLSYTTTSSELGPGKWGAVGETIAYDLVLDAAMRASHFRRRNLRLQASWQWLLDMFAKYYGVSEIYSKLRYLASVMDVATPTEDCLTLVHELLVSIINARDERELNRQEKRIYGDVEEQVSQLLALIFENYKSLDDSSNSGLLDTFQPGNKLAAPGLVPAVKVFTLLNDVLSTEVQGKLRNYFQSAARKRCKRLMSESDEFVASTSEGFLMDPLSLTTAYQKMKNLCGGISNEIFTDIEIHKLHVLPSFIDLPNITASIYSVEVCKRLRDFLVACPPQSPAPPVADLLIATADFQRDLASWGIKPVKDGVDAKELFNLYIRLWIEEKRLQLLEFCKSDKVRSAGITTQHGTAPFVEDVYERLKEMLNEYEVIISRWPEYTLALEQAISDVERAVISALEKHYADVLGPLREVKKMPLQYVQRLARRRSLTLYSVPNQVGAVLNTIRRLLDTLRPKLDGQMKSWVQCLPADGGAHGKVYGERLDEGTVSLRAKYRTYLQAIVEKLSDNAKMQPSTKLKKILQDTREAAAELLMRERMQLLNTQIVETITHLHEVFTTQVFVAVTRGYWDRLGRDVLRFLEGRKENRSWHKSPSIALDILEDVFVTQMQRLEGHSLAEKDLEAPRSVMEARSMLSKDSHNGDSSGYWF